MDTPIVYQKAPCGKCGGEVIIHAPDHTECTKCKQVLWYLVGNGTSMIPKKETLDRLKPFLTN